MLALCRAYLCSVSVLDRNALLLVATTCVVPVAVDVHVLCVLLLRLSA
jgi:hypothetical protein